MNKILCFIVDILYPKRCRFCNEVTGFSSCAKCEEQVKKLKRPIGVPLQRQGRNMDCLAFAFSPYNYDKPVSDAILRLKFSDKPLDERSFAVDIVEEIKQSDEPVKFDIITCVPSTKKEIAEHGRDLPLILAGYVADEMQISFDPDLLVKIKDTKRQMQLSGAQRRKNIKNAFAVNANKQVTGKSVLIIDDVFTTGSTLNECAETLRREGAAFCCGATIAAAVN